MTNLTWEELVYRLNYNPETGEFRWRNPKSGSSVKSGDLTGKTAVRGCKQIYINGKHYYAHRLAWLYMTGEWPESEIDHINMDRSDNRWQNLRKCSRSQNQRNCKRYLNNTSGEKGVSKQGYGYLAEVQYQNKKYTSWHRYKWQAIRAVRRNREFLHGEYCRHD